MLTGSMRAAMRRTQKSTMQHMCTIEPYRVAEDGTVSYGSPIETKCGFDLTSGAFDSGTLYESISASAKLRLPAGVTIGMKDRVTIVAAYGETVTSRVFEVIALPDSFGPSAQVAMLQEIYL